MAQQSVKQLAQTKLLKYPTLSLKEDILGWYGVNPEIPQRSVKERLDLIETKKFVRVGIVVFAGAYRAYWGEVYNSPRVRPATEVFQKDVDLANQIWIANWGTANGPWIYIQKVVEQDSAIYVPSVLSMSGWDNRMLFATHRELGANVNAYYINNNASGFNRGMSNTFSISGYSPVFSGFWVGCNAPDHIFAHEMGHALGLPDNNPDYHNPEVGKIPCNLMNSALNTGREFTISPFPLLNSTQIQNAFASPWLEGGQ